MAPVVVAAEPASAAPVAELDGRPATVKQPIIVIDNYDSFTYNLCQVAYRFTCCFSLFAIHAACGTICMWDIFCYWRGVATTWADIIF